SLTCRGQRYCCRHSLQLLVDLELPSVHVVRQLIDAGVYRTPRKDCKSREVSSNREAGSPIHIVNEVIDARLCPFGPLLQTETSPYDGSEINSWRHGQVVMSHQ